MILEIFQISIRPLILLRTEPNNKNRYKISTIEKHCIDSKKEFNVSVEAALFYCKLNSLPTFDCTEFDFYNNLTSQLEFGWLNDKFVSNIDTYIHTKEIDGENFLLFGDKV
jgi:hypothetical protein